VTMTMIRHTEFVCVCVCVCEVCDDMYAGNFMYKA